MIPGGTSLGGWRGVCRRHDGRTTEAPVVEEVTDTAVPMAEDEAPVLEVGDTAAPVYVEDDEPAERDDDDDDEPPPRRREDTSNSKKMNGRERSPSVERKAAVRGCWTCGAPDHRQRDCPKRRRPDAPVQNDHRDGRRFDDRDGRRFDDREGRRYVAVEGPPRRYESPPRNGRAAYDNGRPQRASYDNGPSQQRATYDGRGRSPMGRSPQRYYPREDHRFRRQSPPRGRPYVASEQAVFFPTGPRTGCFCCGEQGHKQRDCPRKLERPRSPLLPVSGATPRRDRGSPERPRGTTAAVCWTCGDPDHQARDCPKTGGSARGPRPTETKPRDPRNIAWSREIVEGRSTAASILALFERDGADFDSRSLATAAHRIGKFGGPRIRGDSRVALLSETCRKLMGDFNSQEMANTAWGFAKVGHVDDKLFAAIANEAAHRISEFDGQNVANVLWAFAMTKTPAPQLFDAIEQDVPRRVLRDFKPREMANTLWDFAKAGEFKQVFYLTS